MSTVQEIEQAIRQLTPNELARIRALVAELERQGWESRIASGQNQSDDLDDEVQRRQDELRQRVKRLRDEIALMADSLPDVLMKASEIDSPPIVQPARLQTSEEWLAAFHKWVDSHRDVTAIADDSRESIYEGRGE
jgi:hypothetical protein